MRLDKRDFEIVAITERGLAQRRNWTAHDSSERSEMKIKRSYEKRLTREAEVLRYMRMAKKISMNQAAKSLGISSSAIAHIEQGRMGISRVRIASMLSTYGYSENEFLEYIDGKSLPIQYREACIDLIAHLSETQLIAVLPVLKAISAAKN